MSILGNDEALNALSKNSKDPRNDFEILAILLNLELVCCENAMCCVVLRRIADCHKNE